MGYIGGMIHLLTICQVPGTSKQVTTNKHTNPPEKFMPLAPPVWQVKTPWKLEVFMPRVYNCYDPNNQGSFSLNHAHGIHVWYICHYLPTFTIKINHMGYGEIVWDHNIWDHVKLKLNHVGSMIYELELVSTHRESNNQSGCTRSKRTR